MSGRFLGGRIRVVDGEGEIEIPSRQLLDRAVRIALHRPKLDVGMPAAESAQQWWEKGGCHGLVDREVHPPGRRAVQLLDRGHGRFGPGEQTVGSPDQFVARVGESHIAPHLLENRGPDGSFQATELL